MGNPVRHAVPAATQVDASIGGTGDGFTEGFTVQETDGSKRVYILNADTVSFTAGMAVVNPLGSGSSYGSVVRAAAGDDQIPDKVVGFIPSGVTIPVGSRGWAYTYGPKVFALVVTQNAAILKGTRLTLRSVSGVTGLGVLAAGGSAQSIAVATLDIAASATSAVVDLRSQMG